VVRGAGNCFATHTGVFGGLAAAAGRECCPWAHVSVGCNGEAGSSYSNSRRRGSRAAAYLAVTAITEARLREPPRAGLNAAVPSGLGTRSSCATSYGVRGPRQTPPIMFFAGVCEAAAAAVASRSTATGEQVSAQLNGSRGHRRGTRFRGDWRGHPTRGSLQTSAGGDEGKMLQKKEIALARSRFVSGRPPTTSRMVDRRAGAKGGGGGSGARRPM